jgi:DNA-binding transcriptional regulator/RsmH inhibitor MraZ
MRRVVAILTVCLTMPVALPPAQVHGQATAQQGPRLFPFREPGKEGKWGYIDAQGNVAIKPQFSWAADFRDGRAMVVTDKVSGYIDDKGRLAFACPADWEAYGDFSEGMAPFQIHGKWGFCNRDGKVVIAPRHDEAGPFSEGLARVNIGAKPGFLGRPKEGGKWGFIDMTGKVAIPLRFEYAEPFSDGLAFVQEVGRAAAMFIDKKGRVSATPEFDTQGGKQSLFPETSFSEGLAVVVTLDGTGSHAGFIDKAGRFVIPPKFDVAQSFSEGFAVVMVNEQAGYIDHQGRIAITPQFAGADRFSDGLAAVRLKEGAGTENSGNVHPATGFAYIDNRGRVTIPKEGVPKSEPFNDAEGFRDGLARVHVGGRWQTMPDAGVYWKGGTWFYINKKGEIVRRVRADDEEGPRLGGETMRPNRSDD